MIIRYIPNQNPRGQAYNLDFSQLTEIPNPTNFSLGENLLFHDFDQDSKTDMLVGKNSGNVEFNKNTTGGKTPEYKLTNPRFGGLDINFDTRSLSFSIADFDGRGTPQLLTTDYYGATKLYQNFGINTNLKADSTLIYNEITKKNEFKSLGSSISNTVGDLDNDGLPDLILGTNTGGLLFFKNQSVKKAPIIETEKVLIVYPNPTSNFVYIKAPSKGSLSLYNLMGQLLKNSEIDSSETSLDLTFYSSGIYLIKWTGQDGSQLGKKVVVVW